MAVTVTVKKRGVLGNARVVVADVAFDNSYPTGGEALAAKDLGWPGGRIDLLLAAPNGGLIFEFDHTNAKIKALYPTGGSATPAALADPTVAVPVGATAVTSTAAQPDLTETAGRGKEVANATDLSTITSRVTAFEFVNG